MTSRSLLIACALACGCGDPTAATATTEASGAATTTTGPVPEIDGVMVDLVKPGLWQPQAAADDPYADHRPATVDCALGLGYLAEPGGFEVNTGGCSYGAFSQPTLREIVPGAQISLNLYHFDLLAPAPATAHVAVQVGGNVLFEREIEIPGKAGVFQVDLVADFALEAGAPAVFHLHNHGQNTWTLAHIQVEVEGSEQVP